jgi:hypothetical protein
MTRPSVTYAHHVTLGGTRPPIAQCSTTLVVICVSQVSASLCDVFLYVYPEDLRLTLVWHLVGQEHMRQVQG